MHIANEYDIAKQARLDRWNKKGLGREPTRQERIQDTEFDEWSYYFTQYLTKIPEQLYQENKQSPLDHESSWYIRGLDGYDNQDVINSLVVFLHVVSILKQVGLST